MSPPARHAWATTCVSAPVSVCTLQRRPDNCRNHSALTSICVLASVVAFSGSPASLRWRCGAECGKPQLWCAGARSWLNSSSKKKYIYIYGKESVIETTPFSNDRIPYPNLPTRGRKVSSHHRSFRWLPSNKWVRTYVVVIGPHTSSVPELNTSDEWLSWILDQFYDSMLFFPS